MVAELSAQINSASRVGLAGAAQRILGRREAATVEEALAEGFVAAAGIPTRVIGYTFGAG